MKLTSLKEYKSKKPVTLEKRNKRKSKIFENDELNRIIDSNIEEVRRNGYSKLVVPSNLHPIDNNQIPKNVRYISDAIISAGFNAYLCGGTVRDLVQGEVVNDFDIVTDAANDDLEKLFDKIRFFTIPTGHRFSYIEFDDEIIDVATMVNIPTAYRGKKNVPDFDFENLYSRNLLFDAYQRDLPFNSMYYDIGTGDVIDYFGGLYGLREGIISTTVDARDAFDYDPRRAIRALRFASRFGFKLSEETDRVMREYGWDYIERIDSKTLGRNLLEFFSGGFAREGTETLLKYSLFGKLFPPIHDKLNNPNYLDYVLHTARAADWLFDEGTWALPIIVIAAFLWPAVKDAKVTGSEDPVEQVVNSQKSVMGMTESEEEYFKSILIMEEDDYDTVQIKNKVVEIFEKPEFKEGLQILHLYYMDNAEIL